MVFWDSVRLALAQLRVQKLKSFFTLLGVMIGVMFLVAVISIVEGMSRYVEEDFAARLIGVNTFDVRRFPNFTPSENDEQWREYLRRPRVYKTDAELVRAALPPGSKAAMVSENFLYASSPYGRLRQVQAVATEAAYFRIKNYGLASGRVFTDQEVVAGSKAVVIGHDVARHFFPGLDPLGRALRMRGVPYTVVGVIEKQGSVFGFSLDRLAVVPHTAPLQRHLRPRGDIESLLVQATDPVALEEGMEAAREVLRVRRRLGPGQPDNFALETSDGALSFFAGIKSKMVLFGTALPAIGLVVGALVIMNIMLVAVAERTREIGIRKALGARRGDILRQFLIEASTLSAVGAAIGIAAGIALAQLIAATTPLPASVAPWSIALALAVGAGVGVVAGVYPASRAARLDPIAALRQE